METEEISPRKKQIINCLKEGCISDEEIAESLKISVNTVESHIQQLYSLLCIEGKAKRAKLVWEVMRYFVRVIKEIAKLCKDVKEKDPIVAERDKRTGEIISIGGWAENPVYDFAQKILQVLEIEEVNE